MILINPVLEVFIPFEKRMGILQKRDDLPRFSTTSEVVDFLKNNPEVNQRNGKPVQLQWICHDEAWAVREFHMEVGRRGRSWKL